MEETGRGWLQQDPVSIVRLLGAFRQQRMSLTHYHIRCVMPASALIESAASRTTRMRRFADAHAQLERRENWLRCEPGSRWF